MNRKRRSHTSLHLEPLESRLALTANALYFEPAGNVAYPSDRMDERVSFRQLDIPTNQDDPVAAAKDFLDAYHGQLGLPPHVSDSLQELEVKHGFASSHVRFEQTFQGLPVYGGFLSVHFGAERHIQSVHNGYRATLHMEESVVPIISSQQAIEAAKRHANVQVTFSESKSDMRWYVDKSGQTRRAWQVMVYGLRPALGDFHTLVDATDGTVILQENRMAFATGSGNVFQPNPYQSQGDGTDLVDADDANSVALQNQIVQVTLERLDDDTGKLVGEWIDVATLFSPTGNNADADEADRIYDYQRDDPRFEQVVVYHTVDQIQAYIHSLGFDDDNGVPNGIRDFATLAHAHWFADDQSFYSSASDAIHFGDGGVDNAEDADIVAHEYGHALQFDQNALWGGGEMAAMGEGFGDYLAASFHANLGDGTYQSLHAAAVGEWDATSYSSADPPNLRRVDGDKVYPEDVTGQPHEDGEIWSAVLWDLREALGSETLDRLVLESHFALPGNATMRDGALAILDADLNINGSSNSEVIEFWFAERGILADLPTDDHGNDPPSATIVDVPSLTGGVIDQPSDVDYFRFSVTSDTTYRIGTILGSIEDTTLSLFASDGTTLLASDDDGGAGLASLLTWTATEDADYFVRVDNFSVQTGNYELGIETLQPPEDDHGDSADNATAVESVSTTMGSLESESDQDWFVFGVPGGASVRIETELDTLADATLSIIDTDGFTQIAFDDDSGPGRAALIDWIAPAAGFYYIVVDNFELEIGGYTLHVESDREFDVSDFDLDGFSDCADVDALVAEIVAGTNAALYDLNGDTMVDDSDLDAWLAAAGGINLGVGTSYQYGDATLDGVVDVSDFNIWNRWKFSPTAAWCRGDFNADGGTDVPDFNIWNANRFTTALADSQAPKAVTLSEMATLKFFSDPLSYAVADIPAFSPSLSDCRIGAVAVRSNRTLIVGDHGPQDDCVVIDFIFNSWLGLIGHISS